MAAPADPRTTSCGRRVAIVRRNLQSRTRSRKESRRTVSSGARQRLCSSGRCPISTWRGYVQGHGIAYETADAHCRWRQRLTVASVVRSDPGRQTRFTRTLLVDLLRSPHLIVPGEPCARSSVSALDRAAGAAVSRRHGTLKRWLKWEDEQARPALDAALPARCPGAASMSRAGRRITSTRPARRSAFLDAHLRPRWKPQSSARRSRGSRARHLLQRTMKADLAAVCARAHTTMSVVRGRSRRQQCDSGRLARTRPTPRRARAASLARRYAC